MTDQKEHTGKTLSAGRPPPLSAKRTGHDTATVVKQSFSHNRTNAVLVEKKRTILKPGVSAKAPPAPAVRPAAERAQPAAADFEGGATFVIVGSTTAVVLGIVLLLILL